jgi:hypothetical protein
LPYAQAGSIVTVALSPVAMSRTASSQPRITLVCVRANECQDHSVFEPLFLGIF